MIEYQAPFVRPDREECYRTAWGFFAREAPLSSEAGR